MAERFERIEQVSMTSTAQKVIKKAAAGYLPSKTWEENCQPCTVCDRARREYARNYGIEALHRMQHELGESLTECE